jgi:hypothetical protein
MTLSNPSRPSGKRIQFMATCLCDAFYAEAAIATVQVLEYAGCSVQFPEAQTCCGQPAFNGGDWNASRKVVRHTVRTFAGEHPVVVPSGSCAAMLLHGAPLEFEHESDRAEVEALGRRTWELADYLVNRLSGKRSVMYEVATREIPERSLLCLKRNVDQQGAWALGKEFIAVLRERPLPKIEGREGAMFTIYWGEVSADSDGPVEMCKPIPEVDAKALASHYPELTLRTEPAHREAYVALPNDALPTGPGGNPGVQWQLASEALHAWWEEQGINPDELERKPEDLGVRITYLASGPVTEASAPYCDFAVPFA